MLTIVHTISKNGHWVSLFANEDEAERIKGRAISVFKRKEYNGNKKCTSKIPENVLQGDERQES